MTRDHSATASVVIFIVLFILLRPAIASCPAWSESTEVYSNSASQALERRHIRVCIERSDHANLEFSWTSAGPFTNGLDGAVEGRGRLIWRQPGSAPYDARAIESIYDGDMKEGRRHGSGRLETRFGTSYDGNWRDGLPEGEGVLQLSNGDEYRGAFVRGFPSGLGQLIRADGTIVAGALDHSLCADGGATARVPPLRGMICGLAE